MNHLFCPIVTRSETLLETDDVVVFQVVLAKIVESLLFIIISYFSRANTDRSEEQIERQKAQLILPHIVHFLWWLISVDHLRTVKGLRYHADGVGNQLGGK